MVKPRNATGPKTFLVFWPVALVKRQEPQQFPSISWDQRTSFSSLAPSRKKWRVMELEHLSNKPMIPKYLPSFTSHWISKNSVTQNKLSCQMLFVFWADEFVVVWCGDKSLQPGGRIHSASWNIFSQHLVHTLPVGVSAYQRTPCSETHDNLRACLLKNEPPNLPPTNHLHPFPWFLANTLSPI